MRYIYITLIILFTAVVLIFTIQNSAPVTLAFLSAKATLSVSVLEILVYLFGMLTGGSALMLVRSLLKAPARRARRNPRDPPICLFSHREFDNPIDLPHRPLDQLGGQGHVAMRLRNGLRLGHRADDRDVLERVAQADRIASVLDRRGASLPRLLVDPGVLPGLDIRTRSPTRISRPAWRPGRTARIACRRGRCAPSRASPAGGRSCDPGRSGPRPAEQTQHVVVMHHDAGVAQNGETGVADRFDLPLG